MTLVPMSSPDLSDDERQAVRRVLETSHLSMGPQLEAFEQAFASYLGVPHAVGVNSGTSGLHLAVIAAGIGEGDWVVTTPFSFVASANCILYERAVPIFVDVLPETGNLNPSLVSQAAADLARGGPAAQRWLPPSMRAQGGDAESRLKAILAVDVFGQPAELSPILECARGHGIAVIEDACEALGSEQGGKRIGTAADVSVFAFYPNKQMTTGEGGMLATRRGDWDALFRSLRSQGRAASGAWLLHERLGYNYRLDEMSAALGLAQLRRIEELLERRRRVASSYNQRLAGQELIQIPSVASTTTRMGWFVYVVRIRPPARRDAVIQALAQAGIPSRSYFPPIHLQPFYVSRFGYQRGDFPVAEALGETSLALPFSGVMTEQQVELVCQHLTRIVGSPVAR